MTTEEQLKALGAELDDIARIMEMPREDADVPGLALLFRDSLQIAEGALAQLAVGVPKPTREGRAAARLQDRLDRLRSQQLRAWEEAEKVVLSAYLVETVAALEGGTDIDTEEEPLWEVFTHVAADAAEDDDSREPILDTYCAVVAAIHPAAVEEKLVAYARTVAEGVES